MKEYITIAALLTAGSAFANADTLTTTFSNCGADVQAENVTLNVSGMEGISATVDSLVTEDEAVIKLKGINDSAENGQFFSPNSNVALGDPWTATFDYDFGENTLTFDTITLNVGLFAGNGDWQTASATPTFDFVVSLGSVLTDITVTKALAGIGTGATADNTRAEVTIKLAQSITLTGNDVKFALKVDEADRNTQAGCFIGLNSIKFSTSPIPEPSAFGLLAGIGALALVASRRRRK